MSLIYTGDPTSLGGGAAGTSVKQTKINARGGEQALTRKILTKSWNTQYAVGEVNETLPVIGGFRLVNNLGDFLTAIVLAFPLRRATPSLFPIPRITCATRNSVR